MTQRNTITERSWSPTSRTGSTKFACTNKYARNPRWKNFTEGQMQRGFTLFPQQNGLTAETNTRSYNPAEEEAATPLKTKRRRKCKGFCQVEKGKYHKTIVRTRCWTVVIVVFIDMVNFIKVFMAGFFDVANMATLTVIYLICCPNTRLEPQGDLVLRHNSDSVEQFLVFFKLTIGE